MSANPVSGAGYLLRGARLVLRPGLRRYVVIPLLINVAVFATLVVLGARRLGVLVDSLMTWLPDWLDWLAALLWPLFVLVALLVVFFGFSLLANLIAAPFNGLLAEAVEREITGEAGSGPGTPLVAEVARTLASEVNKLGYFALRALPLLLLFAVPGLNLAAPFLWFAFSAWMLALEFSDFPMGNHGIAFREQRRILAGRRLLGLSFGATVMLALMVPLVNFLVIPVAVAGATAMWVDRLRDAVPRAAG